MQIATFVIGSNSICHAPSVFAAARAMNNAALDPRARRAAGDLLARTFDLPSAVATDLATGALPYDVDGSLVTFSAPL